jgi:hypothetical protein
MPESSASELTPDQRFKQIAAILAKGVIRSQRFLQSASPTEEVFSQNSADGLEVPGKTRLSVSRGIGG